MLDIGLQEFIVILVVALLAVGPQRLPDFTTKIGRCVADIRRTIESAKSQLGAEIASQDIAAHPPSPTDLGDVSTRESGSGMDHQEEST